MDAELGDFDDLVRRYRRELHAYCYRATLRDDIRLAISSQVGEWNGRRQVGDALRDGMTSLGQWRLLPIQANRQPGAAGYLRRPGQRDLGSRS